MIGNFPFGVGSHRIARILIGIDEGESAARDLYSNAVSFKKCMADVEEVDREFFRLPGSEQLCLLISVSVAGADDSQLRAQTHRTAVRIDITNFGREIRIQGIAGRIQIHCHPADYFDWFFKDVACINQDIVSTFDGSLVGSVASSFDILGCRIFGIIDVRIRFFIPRFFPNQKNLP